MTKTERITLHICNKHSIGEPYPFTTLETEITLTLKEKLILAALFGLLSVVISLIAIGIWTVWGWL